MIVAVVAGALMGLSVAPRAWIVGAIGLAPLMALAMWHQSEATDARAAVKRGVLVGLVTGVACHAIVMYWVVGLLHNVGRLPFVLAIPLATLMWVAQSGPLMLGGGFAGYLSARGFPVWLALPLCLSVGFAFVWQIFPWHPSVGMLPWLAWVQAADVGGQPLLDVFVLLGGSALGVALLQKSGRHALLGAACLLLPALYGYARLPGVRSVRAAADTIEVGLIQPNVGMYEKYDGRLFQQQLELMQRLTVEAEAAGAELVIWPEASYPYGIHPAATHDRRGHRSAIYRNGVRGPLLVGSIVRGPNCENYNSVVGLETDGTFVGRSDKVELVPFGEHVHLWSVLPPLQEMFECPGTLVGEARPLELADTRVGILNCYEDILEGHGRTVALSNPDFLVNVTNDSWFGPTSEPALHLMVARMRSIETRRDLVRSVNTGLSGLVASTGESLVQTESDVVLQRVVTVTKQRGETLYMRFGAHFRWLLLLALAYACVIARRRGAPPNAETSSHAEADSGEPGDSGEATEPGASSGDPPATPISDA